MNSTVALVVDQDLPPETPTVLAKLANERGYQIRIGYSPEHDANHNFDELMLYADENLSIAVAAVQNPQPGSRASIPYERLIKAGAVIVAILEKYHREQPKLCDRGDVELTRIKAKG